MYVMFLGFFTQVAPHLGEGAFWYQWDQLLDPCQRFGWTNLLFVNNFIPLQVATTQTCFYQSWYLAVDMQLFIFAPLLVFWYLSDPVGGKYATAALTLLSVVVTFILTFTQRWSLNSFDGAPVARFDIEGYSKPHVRAQSYFAGMLLGMIMKEWRAPLRKSWKTDLTMAVSIFVLLFMSLITVTGVYSRRACQPWESPWEDGCGSTWSPQATFWYTGTSRAFWAASMTAVIALCLKDAGGIINSFLSASFWAPYSYLTFGTYLVHPTVILVMQLSDDQKKYFTLKSFMMRYISVVVVSFAIALVFSLLVEQPLAKITKRYVLRAKKPRQTTRNGTSPDKDESLQERLMMDGDVTASGYGSIGGKAEVKMT